MPARARIADLIAVLGAAVGLRTCAVILLLLTGCSRPLPEEGSAGATLYVEHCAGCHVAYQPRLLTAQMWETMMTRMDVTLRRRGLELSAADRAEILAYLKRNAGTR